MATDRQIATNRANAAHSTGPKTPEGEAAARFNRVTHGLDSPAPVVPGERAEDWAAHRDGIVRSLAPVGPLETELADRAALLFWRLRRIGRYETAAATAAFDHTLDTLTGASSPVDAPPDPIAGLRGRREKLRAELDQLAACAALVRDLPGLPDDHRLPAPTPGQLLDDVCDDECPDGTFMLELLEHVPLPDEAWDNLIEWGGWTAGTVRAALAEIATAAERTPAQVLARAGWRLDRAVADQRAEIERAEAELARAEADRAAAVARAQELSLLPTPAVDKVIRYEAHLSRQLNQTLQLLDRFQAARVAGRFRPPVEAGGWDPGRESAGGPGDECADRTQPGTGAPVAETAGSVALTGEAADSADRTRSAAGSPVVAAEAPSPARKAVGSTNRTHVRPEDPSSAADREAIAAYRAEFIRQMTQMNGPDRSGGQQSGPVRHER